MVSTLNLLIQGLTLIYLVEICWYQLNRLFLTCIYLNFSRIIGASIAKLKIYVKFDGMDFFISESIVQSALIILKLDASNKSYLKFPWYTETKKVVIELTTALSTNMFIVIILRLFESFELVLCSVTSWKSAGRQSREALGIPV